MDTKEKQIETLKRFESSNAFTQEEKDIIVNSIRQFERKDFEEWLQSDESKITSDDFAIIWSYWMIYNSPFK